MKNKFDTNNWTIKNWINHLESKLGRILRNDEIDLLQLNYKLFDFNDIFNNTDIELPFLSTPDYKKYIPNTTISMLLDLFKFNIYLGNQIELLYKFIDLKMKSEIKKILENNKINFQENLYSSNNLLILNKEMKNKNNNQSYKFFYNIDKMDFSQNSKNKFLKILNVNEIFDNFTFGDGFIMFSWMNKYIGSWNNKYLWK